MTELLRLLKRRLGAGTTRRRQRDALDEDVTFRVRALSDDGPSEGGQAHRDFKPIDEIVAFPAGRRSAVVWVAVWADGTRSTTGFWVVADGPVPMRDAARIPTRRLDANEASVGSYRARAGTGVTVVPIPVAVAQPVADDTDLVIDFTAPDGTTVWPLRQEVTIPAGGTQAFSWVLAIDGDDVFEPSARIIVTVRGLPFDPSTQTGFLTLYDDD